MVTRLWIILGCLFWLSGTVSAESESASRDLAAGLEWTDAERALLRSLSLQALPELPLAPSNRVANSAAAAALGQQLFFDRDLVPNANKACADCHQPALFFTDGEALGAGVGRNTQSLFGVAYQDWWYWDGRRDSLWSQALTPLEAANEMAGDRLAVTRRLGRDLTLRRRYEKVFGELPAVLMDPGLPPHASPVGDEEAQRHWQQLPASAQQAINQTFANVGKAIAAYERTLKPAPTPFDQFVVSLSMTEAGDQKPVVHKPVVHKPVVPTALSVAAQKGAKLFIDGTKTQCMRCHNGPLLSNGGFHNIGTGQFGGNNIDLGRLHGLTAVIENEFNCLGPYSDAPEKACSALRFLDPQASGHTAGAFKTPSLRYLSKTGPYFHDGRFATLRAVIGYYQNPPNGAEAPPHELTPLSLTATEVDQLIAFLVSLSPR